MNILGIAAFLVTAAAGYWVLTLSDKEGNRHAKLGRFLGWGILIFALLGVLSQLVFGARFLGRPGRGNSLMDHPGHGHGHWGGGDDREDEKPGSGDQ